jgi:hypothetical protein
MAVELQHARAACLLVQTIHILSHNIEVAVVLSLEVSLKPAQCLVGGIWFRSREQMERCKASRPIPLSMIL